MKIIVATAYAINPFKGSEDGMGWNFVLQVARFNKIIAITRENNRPNIEQYMQDNPNETYANIRFEYFDLPYWMRFWKKGGRGAMLYYWMWQRGVVSFIQKLNLDFDIVHNLNFHNDWTPSYLWKLNKPFVWGPIGHHPKIPAQYLKNYGLNHLIKDRLTWFIKLLFWQFSGNLNLTKRKAGHILCMNEGVPETLGLDDKYSIIPSVATEDYGWKKDTDSREDFTLISAGRFVPLKGFDLTIRAFAAFVEKLEAKDRARCKLLLVGSGAEQKHLETLVSSLAIQGHVKFIPWIEREALMKLYQDAAAFLFPSHEGAGMVVAESLSFGLPVICLDNEGPGQFIDSSCGYAIPQGAYNDTVEKLAAAAYDLFKNPKKRQTMRLAARKRFETKFHWDRRGEQLQKIYAEV